MTISKERRLKVYEWLDTPESQKVPQSAPEFRHSIHMGARVFKNLRIEWQIQRHEEEQTALNLKGAFDYIEREGKSPKNITNDLQRWSAVEAAIYKKALEGTVAAQELYARLKGRLIEKKEIKVGRLEDDEYYALRNQAQRDISSRGYGEVEGDRKVLPQPALLLEESCLAPEQDNQEDS